MINRNIGIVEIRYGSRIISKYIYRVKSDTHTVKAYMAYSLHYNCS